MKRVLSTIVCALVSLAFAGLVSAQSTATHSPNAEPEASVGQGQSPVETKPEKKAKKKKKKAKKAKKPASDTGMQGGTSGTGTGGTPETPVQPVPSKPGY